MRTEADASSVLVTLRRAARVLILAAIAIAIAPNAHAAPTYTVLDLGEPSDSSDPPSVKAMGLNSLGEVTGFYRREDGTQQAFLYSLGDMHGLGTLLDGTHSVGIAVNDASRVTGSSRVSGSSSDERAFVHNGVFMEDLGTLGGAVSQGRGINAKGEVTGEAAVDAIFRHAFLFNGAAMSDLDFGNVSSGGFDINDAGRITGGFTTPGPKHAFFYDGFFMDDIGTLGGFVSEGRGINATGHVTGFSFTSGGSQHAFVWDGTTMHDLGTLGGPKSFGNSINDAGLVVGTSDIDQTTRTHAFVWDGAMHDLNDLVTGLPPGVTIELESAEWGGSINGSGQIAATGRYLTGGPGSGGTYAFLLTPVSTSAPALYEEVSNLDDFPSAPPYPVVPLSLGTNSILGGTSISGDAVDSLSVSVPAGHELASVTYVFTSSALIRDGATLTNAVSGFSLVAADGGATAPAGEDVDMIPGLCSLFVTPPCGPSSARAVEVTLFEDALPRSEGVYSIEQRALTVNDPELITWSSRYRIDLVVVPEPPALASAAVAAIAVATMARRLAYRTRKRSS